MPGRSASSSASSSTSSPTPPRWTAAQFNAWLLANFHVDHLDRIRTWNLAAAVIRALRDIVPPADPTMQPARSAPDAGEAMLGRSPRGTFEPWPTDHRTVVGQAASSSSAGKPGRTARRHLPDVQLRTPTRPTARKGGASAGRLFTAAACPLSPWSAPSVSRVGQVHRRTAAGHRRPIP